MESLGTIMHWGHTPGINCFDDTGIDVNNDDKELNILMSENGGDGRHLFKSLADEVLNLKKQREKPINIYFHERQKENIARVILFITLFCETGISKRERMEMYLDLFGNTLIRDKTASYLEEITPELIQLITEDEKCKSVIKDLINFETLKYKDRDDIEDIFSSFLQCHPFDIEKLRDNRLRGLFQDRYDHRRNLVDWDFNFYIKKFAPAVNLQEYRQWRLNGIAFETRLATGSIPNRTYASFVPGKTKKGNDSIIVRGFWGDIVNSPFIAFGNEVWKEPERTRFFRELNYQKVYSNADISEYTVQQFIHKLEELEEYEYPFERLKHVLGEKKFRETDPEYHKKKMEEEKKAEEAKKAKKDKKKKGKKQEPVEDEEPMIQEITEEEAQKIEEEKKQAESEIVESETNPSTPEEVKKTLEGAGQKTINLLDIDEGKNVVSKENEGTRKLLDGFKKLNVKIHFVSDEIKSLHKKKHYKNLFDIGVLSMQSANQIDQDINKLFKKDAKVHVETSDNLVILKKEQQEKYRELVEEKCKAAKWNKVEKYKYNHHVLYTVDKEEDEQEEEKQEDEEDLFDLSGL